MNKLFDIPIYAIQKDVLDKRVNIKKEKYIENYYKHNLQRDDNTLKKSLELITYPMCLWEYNHIIGYLQINVNSQDVIFELYLPMESPKRYYWNSKKKDFIVNQMSPNNHFYIGNKSSEDIRNWITDYVEELCKRMKKRGYYVDLSAFDTVNKYIDYRSLIEEEVWING